MALDVEGAAAISFPRLWYSVLEPMEVQARKEALGVVRIEFTRH